MKRTLIATTLLVLVVVVLIFLFKTKHKSSPSSVSIDTSLERQDVDLSYSNLPLSTTDAIEDCYLTTEQSCFPSIQPIYDSENKLRSFRIAARPNLPLSRSSSFYMLAAADLDFSLFYFTNNNTSTQNGLERIMDLSYTNNLNPLAVALAIKHASSAKPKSMSQEEIRNLLENSSTKIIPAPEGQELEQTTFSFINLAVSNLKRNKDAYVGENQEIISSFSPKERSLYSSLLPSPLGSYNKAFAHYIISNKGLDAYRLFVNDFVFLTPVPGTYDVLNSAAYIENPNFIVCAPNALRCKLENNTAICQDESEVFVGCE